MHLELPGIGYKQGKRDMVVTALDPVALVKTVTTPDLWNPLADEQPHGNRKQDKGHRAGIAQYLEDEENFVLSAVVLYASRRDAVFEPTGGDANGPVQAGTLKLNFGAVFEVGDGQHRIGAYSDVMARHTGNEDPVLRRMLDSGQPVVVVIDDEPANRAQDFADLQRNVKPPSSSLAQSMDRRQPMNRLLIDLVRNGALPVFAGDRIEFQKDSPAKNSAQLYSFKTIRYMSGTVLTGTGQRSTRGWDKAVNERVGEHPDESRAALIEFWKAFGTLPPIAAIIGGESTPAKLRAETLLGAAGVLYALSDAVHAASNSGIRLGDAVAALGGVSFARPAVPAEGAPALTLEDSIFVSTLIDPETAKVGSGRPAWEAAAEYLLTAIMDVRAAA